jgi:hypothetical protein
VPFLRYYHDRKGSIPPCTWCKEPAGELVHHLVRCPAMPASCAGLLAEARTELRATSPLGASASNDFVTMAIFRMQWGRMKQAPARAALRALAHLINSYRRTIGEVEEGDNPITAVRSVDVAYTIEEDSEEEDGP